MAIPTSFNSMHSAAIPTKMPPTISSARPLPDAADQATAAALVPSLHCSPPLLADKIVAMSGASLSDATRSRNVATAALGVGGMANGDVVANSSVGQGNVTRTGSNEVP